MTKILQEAEVSLDTLADHLENSGWNVELMKNRLCLHTPKGLGFSIRLDEERQYIRLSTDLPIKKEFTDGLELVNVANQEVFLGRFSLDSDNDLIIMYYMSYERGLILPQFARIVCRFSGMLEHVLERFDKDDSVFALGSEDATKIESAPALLQ